MADEALRCGNIVKNLLVFARQRGVSFQSVRLGEVIARCVLLMNHHARMHNVDLKTSRTGMTFWNATRTRFSRCLSCSWSTPSRRCREERIAGRGDPLPGHSRVGAGGADPPYGQRYRDRHERG